VRDGAAAAAWVHRYPLDMAQEDLEIRQVNDNLFTASVGGTEVCRVSVAVADGVWELYSTVTSPGHQGRGIASQLVRHALDAAEEAGVRVIPSCWYVDGLMERHAPRYDHLRLRNDLATAEEGETCRIAPAVLRQR
jgi:uncharacterized protein